MTGLHPGHSAIRDNKEIQPEGQASLPAGTETLARALRKVGYRTGCFGKWGLGAPGSPGEPLRQGFDRFFGYNCQRHAHNYYPSYLWDNDQRRPLDNPEFSPHQRLPEHLDPNDPASYKQYTGRQYSADLIAEEARKFVRAHSTRPFFLAWTTTVPHVALQVPDEELAEYLGRWPETPYRGERRYLPHRTPRAAYAAMITRLDREVGRMMQLVRELGLEQRTIFIFVSDNGPVTGGTGGTDYSFFNSNAHLRAGKGAVYEGGIRVPMIISWPGRIAAGTQSDRVTGFEDWFPTLLELAGLQAPGGLDGISFAPTLFGGNQTPRPFLYREFPAYGGQQCLLSGDWKLVRRDLNPNRSEAFEARPTTELYNLALDPLERQDVAAANPKVVARLEEMARSQHSNSDMFPFPALDT